MAAALADRALVRTWPCAAPCLPSADDAAARVVPAYLGAYGPAGPETFDPWLSRGASRRAVPRGWFRRLADEGTLAEVSVDGQPGYARAADVDEIAAAEPTDEVRLGSCRRPGGPT